MFRLELLNSSSTPLGYGPIFTATQLTDVARLDAIGELRFRMPATDPLTQYLASGIYVDAYDAVDGYIGRYLYRQKRLSESGGQTAMVEVSCDDLLRELSRTSVHFFRGWSNTDVATVVSALLALASGWGDGSIEAAIGNTTIEYHGESVLIAIDALRDRWNKHYRLGTTTRTLDFGAFGTDSGMRLIRATALPIEAYNDDKVAFVTSIELTEEDETIANRIIPLGAGQGKAQLTIAGATGGTYTVQNALNADGSSFYYIEDATSVAAYGRRERVLTVPQIRPLSNSDTAMSQARTALVLAAEAYIARHLIPKVTYQVLVEKLRTAVKPGDLITLQYRGVVNQDGRPYTFIDVNSTFYVMDIERRRAQSGDRETRLNIASIADRRTADSDVMVDVLSDLRALKVHVPINLAYSPVGPYVRRIDPSNTATFTIRVNSEVLGINYCRVHFKTEPLRSSVTSSGAGSAHSHTLSIGASGAHTHTVDIGAGGSHSHGFSAAASGALTSLTSTHDHKVWVYYNSGSAHPTVGIPDSGVSHYFTATGITADRYANTESEATHVHEIPSHTHTGSTVQSATHSHPGEAAASATHTHTGLATSSESAHTHGLTYGLYEDTHYPQNISVAIDSVDRTAVLGGPWALTDAQVDVGPLDITDYLSTTPSIRQNHAVVFSCANPTGGPNSPGTAADDATVGTVAWSNVNNALAEDGSSASAAISSSAVSHYLKVSNFGFSIPTAGTIVGITVEVKKQATGGIRDNSVKLVKSDGTLGTEDKTGGGYWATSMTWVTYGGSSDLWSDVWTPTDINDADFGLAFSAKAWGGTLAEVDHVRITIYYTVPNRGEIEFEADMLCTVQAIAVS